jgi:serine/threonine protein kinase
VSSDPKLPAIVNSDEVDRDHDTSLSGPTLLAELDVLGNWSGKGQHVEFARHEAVPLEQGTFLGRGTFADVYEVKCRGLSMARKQIYCTRRMKIADVKLEIDILKKLSHKHVVTLLGSYTQSNILGLLLHPVAICDLGKFLDELDENQHLAQADHSEEFKKLMNCLGFQNDIRGMRDRLNRVYGCLANAIEYLHDSDIRHKDIKPQNILLGPKDCLYVTDFGLSRDTADASSSVTDGDARGTYKYCAPEVARYSPRGRAADIYSLGCVFLEINTVHRKLSLSAFEKFRIESGDRSYQNYPEKLQEWMSRLRESSMDRIDTGIFDIVDIIGKMVSQIATDRPVIGSVCSSLYVLGDLVYFGECCPSSRIREATDQNIKLSSFSVSAYTNGSDVVDRK